MQIAAPAIPSGPLAALDQPPQRARFTKLDADGQALPASAADWSYVRVDTAGRPLRHARRQPRRSAYDAQRGRQGLPAFCEGEVRPLLSRRGQEGDRGLRVGLVERHSAAPAALLSQCGVSGATNRNGANP